MAPALVEHSAAKERNSVSKSYLDKFSCIPPLDLVLVDKIKRVDSSSILKNKLFSPAVTSRNIYKEKENKYIPQTMTQVSAANKVSAADMTHTASVIPPKVCTSTHTVTSSCINFVMPKLEFNNKIKVPDKETIPVNGVDLISTHETCKTFEERIHQPVATLEPNYILSRVKQKQELIQEKFGQITKSITSINSSVKKFRLRNASSHVACHIRKPKDSLITEATEKHFKNEIKDKDSKYFNNGVDSVTCDVASSSQHQKLCRSNNDLSKLYDIVTCLEDDDTDFEEDFDSRVKVPVSRGKKRSENNPPTAAAMHQWKQKRAKVGSQCSWLSLQIDSLDKKISCLHKIHRKLKLERQTSRTVNFEPIVKNEQELSTDQNGVLPAIPTTEEQLCSMSGSSRTCSISTAWSHNYIRKPPVTATTKCYGCRNLQSINSCRFCAQPNKNYCQNNFSQNLTADLDGSYHSTLSYENDISLSFLLEETLRKKRINTKVTISKSTKKKKKLKPLTPQEKHKISPATTEVKTKSKNERSRSDEYSRKRQHSIVDRESSGRFRKLRKFSDSFSCDSSKPSTPTNELISPLSQSFNASGLFSSSFNKNKKKLSSSGDYDINNIVIPYSIASSTRVERIQYKEIPTPGWRSIDGDITDRENEEDRELTDDEFFVERHARCEVLERKRFTDFFHLSTSLNRRNRPNRMSSEGPNSEPPSPIIVDDPTRSYTGSPADSPNGLGSFKNVASTSNLFACTDDERDPPWMAREFPLPEKEWVDIKTYTELLSPTISPSCDSKTLASLKQVSQKLLASDTPRSSPLQSPISLSSPSTPAEFNSNWTVKVLDDPLIDVVTSEKQRKGIVLKLAKK